ncbi:hypothetical protein LINGRAHAP2_LOCUS20287, partial [Linum grandiflorum]
MAEWTNPDNAPYLDNQDFAKCDYIFFPCHGGDDEHYYVFVIDFKLGQKVFLNSRACTGDYTTKPRYHETFTRLMEYA